MPQDDDNNTTSEAPFHAMNNHETDDDDDDVIQPALDDFFDTATNSGQQPPGSQYHLASERFIFDGEDEDVIVSPPSSLANPYSGSNSEPLLIPGYHISGGFQHLHSSFDDDDDNHTNFSADHPLALPFHRLQRQSTTRHELSGLNYLNLLIYGVYVTISILFGSGVVSWLPSPWTVTTLPDYETLLTPSQWAGDYLWIPVLVLEGLFCLAQLLPTVRSRPEVVDGVGYYWFYSALGQSLTTVLFCLKWILPAWFVLALTSASLLVLHVRLQQHHPTTLLYKTWKFWIFRVPFDVHLGWLLPLLASRGSMIFRHYGSHSVGLQLGADIVAMALLLPCAGAYLVKNRGPQDWVVPLLILWAYIGIACRLLHTPEALVTLYGRDIVVAVRGAAWCFAGTVSLLLLPRIVIWVTREFLTIRVVQLTEDDEGEDEDGDDLLLNDPRDANVVGMSQF